MPAGGTYPFSLPANESPHRPLPFPPPDKKPYEAEHSNQTQSHGSGRVKRASWAAAVTVRRAKHARRRRSFEIDPRSIIKSLRTTGSTLRLSFRSVSAKQQNIYRRPPGRITARHTAPRPFFVRASGLFVPAGNAGAVCVLSPVLRARSVGGVRPEIFGFQPKNFCRPPSPEPRNSRQDREFQGRAVCIAARQAR